MSFSERLISTLQNLEAGQWLVLQKANSQSEWIQFVCQGKAGFRLETKSNWFRGDDEQLSTEQTDGLLLRGWLPPTGSDQESDPISDPHGSPNFFVQLPVKLSQKKLSSLVAQTFIDVLAVNEPDGLMYEAFESSGTPLYIADLGLKSAANSTDENPELCKAVLALVKEITSIPDLCWDADSDIGPIGFGGIRTYVRIVEGGRYLRFYSPLMNGAYETLALLSKLNELNTVAGFMHLCLNGDCVMSVADVPASPLTTAHIAQVLANFMQVSDEFATELVAEFTDLESTIETMH